MSAVKRTGSPALSALESLLVGLCQNCRYSRRITSAKGSNFWLCERSAQEPEHFRKYPVLPVVRCYGFEESTR